MTTVTANITSEVADQEQVAEMLEERTYAKWEGNHYKGDLNERASDFAATLSKMPTDTPKGIKFSENNYFDTIAKDATREEVERVRSIDADYAAALHAVSADTFLGRAIADPEVQTMNVVAKLGPNTSYEDSYRRFDSRSVSQGPKAERITQETYGYHNPRIVTAYKGFNDSCVAVHNLAKDLLG